MSLESMAKFILLTGVILVFFGLLLWLASKVGLGHLPGDIYIKRNNFAFYFPLGTAIFLSFLLTLLLNLFFFLRK
jgi:cytosine/uracil/thiamine/allantoin permease